MTAQAADGNANHFRQKGRAAAATQKSASVQTNTPRMTRRAVSNSGQVSTPRNFNTARYRQGNVTAETNANRRMLRNDRVRVSNDTNVSSNVSVNRNRVRNRDVTVRNGNRFRSNTDVAVNRDRNLRVNRDQNVIFNRERNIHRNVVVTNNWRSQRFSGQNYAAFRNYHQQWHDRGWWNSHYSRITFVFGAPYYWDSGYWYPAWGYNTGYVYPYDGPIYGYGNLTPDQVVVNVQAQLQRDGYYDGPVDGQLGPMTREAIAQFQADHGLAVTSAVDEPTLATLGLV